MPIALLYALAATTTVDLLSPRLILQGGLHNALVAAFGIGAYLWPLLLLAIGTALLRARVVPGYVPSRAELTGWAGLFLTCLVALQSVGAAIDTGATNYGGLLGSALRATTDWAVQPLGSALFWLAAGGASLALALGANPRAVTARLRAWPVAQWHRLDAILFREAAPAAPPDEWEVPEPVAHLQPGAVEAPPRRARVPIVRAADRVVVTPPVAPEPEVVVPAPGPAPTDRWQLPQVSLLQKTESAMPSQVDVQRRINIIEQTYADFDVAVKVTTVNPGPTVTQFGIEPGFRERVDRRGNVLRREKVKVAEITSLVNDLSLALAAPSVRIEAPVPGREFVGLEVPNGTPTVVGLRRLLESASFQKLKARGRLAVALGEDVSGQGVAGDLARMPHLLIAGQTGSGKSVCVNSLIVSLLLHTTPEQLRLILVDPKRVELTGYRDIPHLLCPVVVEAEKVVNVLRWVVGEMDRRYRLFEQEGARNLDAHNALSDSEPKLERLPYIVVIIDELADLMMLAPEEVERLLCRLAQLARATGIHLVVATQRPSVNVITGLIKANFPTRISFTVASQVDSRTILDTVGAEKLLGKGDMLYLPPDAPKPIRLQGAYVSDDEIAPIIARWREQGKPNYVEELVNAEAYVPGAGEDQADVELYEQAVEVVADVSRLSVSLLQRRLRIGYARAVKLIERLETDGMIEPIGSRGQGWRPTSAAESADHEEE